MFLVIGQPNDSLQKKKTIKTFVCWDASQLIIMDLQEGMVIKGT